MPSRLLMVFILLHKSLGISLNNISIKSKDAYTIGDIVDTIKTSSVFTCLHKCKIHGKCNVINFNMAEKQCELVNTQFLSESPVEKTQNWITLENIGKDWQICPNPNSFPSIDNLPPCYQPTRLKICGNLSENYIFDASTSPNVSICLSGNPRPNVTWSFKAKGVSSVALLDASTHSYNFTYQLPPLTSSMCGEVVSFHAVGYAGETVSGNASIIVDFTIPKLENLKFVLNKSSNCGQLTWRPIFLSTGNCKLKYFVLIKKINSTNAVLYKVAGFFKKCNNLEDVEAARVYAGYMDKKGPLSAIAPFERVTLTCSFMFGYGYASSQISIGSVSGEEDCKERCFQRHMNDPTVDGIIVSTSYKQCYCLKNIGGMSFSSNFKSCYIRNS